MAIVKTSFSRAKYAGAEILAMFAIFTMSPAANVKLVCRAPSVELKS